MRTLQPLLAMYLLIFGGSEASASKLECPLAQGGGEQGILQETPQRIATVGQRLGKGSENKIREAVAVVRGRYPHSSRAAVVNYLITAYCPKVRDNSALDLAGKRGALRAFAARAEQIVSKP